jgi:hypothetical protein
MVVQAAVLQDKAERLKRSICAGTSLLGLATFACLSMVWWPMYRYLVTDMLKTPIFSAKERNITGVQCYTWPIVIVPMLLPYKALLLAVWLTTLVKMVPAPIQSWHMGSITGAALQIDQCISINHPAESRIDKAQSISLAFIQKSSANLVAIAYDLQMGSSICIAHAGTSTCTLVQSHSTAGRVWVTLHACEMPAPLSKFIVSVCSGRRCSSETSWAFKCAGESWHWTCCPRCGDPFDIHTCIHHLMFCRGILPSIDNEWASP